MDHKKTRDAEGRECTKKISSKKRKMSKECESTLESSGNNNGLEQKASTGKSKKVSKTNMSVNSEAACKDSHEACTDSDRNMRKQKKLKRKLEKQLKRQAEAVSKDKTDSDSSANTDPVAATQALEYLHKWHKDRKHWSFQKVRQVWLLQHLYDTKQLSDEDFEIMLQYMEALKGKGRELTVKKAEDMLSKYTVFNDSDTTEPPPVDIHARAKAVIQTLSVPV